jgi:hypothetical protein
MTYPTIQAALAAEHAHDLHREAQRTHLARLARCCQPAAWRTAARSLATWLASRRLTAAEPAACPTC